MSEVKQLISAHYRPKVARVFEDGPDLYVRALSGTGRAKYMRLAEQAKTDGSNLIAHIVAMGLCDQQGTLAYDADNAADIAALGECDGEFLERVGLKIFEISGLKATAEADAAGK